MKINLAYDADLLVIGNIDTNGYNQRGGIYFVGYSIANILLDNKDINLYFYVPESMINDADYWLHKIYKNRNINIITENSKEWYKINAFYSFYRRADNFIIKNKYIQKYIQIHDLTPVIDNNLDWGNGVFKYINKEYIYFADSQYTKDELIKYSKNTIDNVYVTLLGYDDNRFIKKERNEDILKKYNIPLDKKYIFTLCGLYPRKNLIRNIRTFFQFIDKHNIKDMVFVMGGYNSESFINKFYEEIYEYKDRIIRIGYVEDEDVPYLYSSAEWFIYTSQLEGFGLPPLEAMACGCPVITSNNSSLPEVVGDSGIMIDWDSDEQHIEAYEKYYFDENFRKKMAEKGLERSKLFSWEKCTNEILKIINDNYIKYNLIWLKLHYIISRFLNLNFNKIENDKFYIFKIFFIKISIKKRG